MRPPLTTSRSTAARRVPVLAAAATAATALVLAACGDGGGIDVETALATYPEVTDQVATAITGDVAPLADDGAVPGSTTPRRSAE